MDGLITIRQTTHRIERAFLLLSVIALLCSGCVTAGGHWTGRDEITGILHKQAVAWNAGNIDTFMKPYRKSPDLTFSSGGRVTRGWDETLANYRRRYPTREAMGRLTFDELEITRLSRNVALVLGRWQLEREEPIGGVFSLVLKKESGRWAIVHDHTSRDEP